TVSVTDASINPELILQMFGAMNSEQKAFKQSGGCQCITR
ncbi:MAG: hypothetical protein ACI9FU_001680, partial [Granulosicoccus sp.]